MKRIAFLLTIGCLAGPAVASAKLPHPSATLIVPVRSIGGVGIGMSKAAVFRHWGHTSCFGGGEVCYWYGPGSQLHAERAAVGFHNSKVTSVSINAATTASQKFVPGQLSSWKTDKGIHLGSFASSVGTAYRHTGGLRKNDSEGVRGWDIIHGDDTLRFGGFDIGPSKGRLRYIQLYCTPLPGQC